MSLRRLLSTIAFALIAATVPVAGTRENPAGLSWLRPPARRETAAACPKWTASARHADV